MTHGVRKSVENDAFPSRVPSGRGFRFTRRAGFQALSTFAMGVLVSVFASAQVNVTTYHNDIGRTGQNLNETVLTTSNVNATSFGKLFSQPVDGQVYAQPLYLSGITVSGATHNVVFVATENDSVYAFDADSNGGTNSVPLWKASMLLAAHGAAAGATTIPSSLVSTDIQPQVGITGTPVIDPVSGTLYVVSAALEGGSAVQRLHALDVTSGAEKFGGPVVITASVAGTGNGSVSGKLTFESLYENQRPGLLLLNGIVYIGFASHGDNGPWHGWILGYNATTLAQTGAYCPSPNGTGSGFWMSGGGLAADQLNPATQPYGRMFVPTGNGDYNATKPYTNSMDFGDTDLNLNLANGAPTVTDEFTPYLQEQDDAEDGDVASGGLVVLPTQTTGSVPNLAVQSGKNGWIYLLNRDNMGGYSTSTDNIVQEIGFAVGQTGVWSSPAYWNGNIYYWGVYDNLKSFALTNGKLATTPTKSAEQYGFPGSTPSISANGSTQGILWSIDSEAYGEGPAILQAHNASSVGTTLYSSTTNATRDTAGGAVKFAVPTVVNGKVYVGTAAEVDVYGLLAGASQTSAPTFTPGTESFAGSVTVSLADSTPNSNIYYTTDGSAATTSSTLYSVPIALTSTETINAIATATGLLTSSQSSATYTNTSQANAVTFSLPTGTYTSAQTLTLSDVTANAAIYYTTNGTTPTVSSTLYSGPIAINATETVTAIAIAPGVSNSPIISQTYTIAIGATGINFGQGFASSSGSVILNGSTQLNDTRLQLTDGLANQAGSAWYKTPVNIQSFTNNFNFQLSNPAANGITFTIQNASQGTAALGGSGSNLGYAPITNSIALKFDFTTPVGNGTDSTGVYENGAVPTTPAIDLSGTGINLASDDEMAVQMVYDGTTLTVTITDLITSATWSSSAAINIPSVIGSNTAYVGFTGSTSASASSQKILTWSFVSSATLSAVAMPVFAPLAGSYTSAQSVTISDSTANATIYYTTNGSTPTTSSVIYSGPVAVGASETLNAIAVASGFSNSAVATAAYTITLPAATPIFSVAPGAYGSALSVIISDTTTGAKIYYTTNGTTPTTSSTLYSGVISVSANETLNAIAVATGFSNSAVATAAYTITLPAATPAFSVAAGTYTSAQSVTISDTTTGAKIYYTTNGTAPTTSSTLFSGAISVSASETLSSMAVATGFSNSAVASAAYQIGSPPVATPVFSVAGGTYTSRPTVTITDATPGAVIYYTLNGTSPTNKSSLYTGPLTILGPATLQAIAYATGAPASSVASATYTLNVAAPVFNPPSGTYPGPLTFTVSLATPTATLYDAVNSNTFVAYTGPITITSTSKVFAVGQETGFTQSPLVQAVYTIEPAAATPVFSVAAGTYTNAQSVTISDTTAGAKIYYTTNGTVPTASSPVYSGAISVGASETLSAIAVATGFSNSAVGIAAYTISSTQAATPVLSVAGGTYTSRPTVTITDATPGAVIYYTLNGTSPTNKSSLYTGPLTILSSETLQAIAYATGVAQSNLASATYTLNVAAPVFNPPSGTYPGPLTFTVSLATPTATLYDAVNSDTFVAYTGPITIASTSKVYAVGQETGFTQSPTVAAVYTIEPAAATPVFSVAAGTYASAQTVTISDTTAGAKIYYTTNGTTPTTSSSVYSGAISVSVTETLKAIAVATGFSNSAVGTAAYTINLATPAVNFASGFTSTNLSLMNGATITSGALQLTDGGQTEGRDAWFTTPVNVQAFTTDFNFQATSATADGFTFAIQKSSGGINALGNGGASLGYGGIGSSVAIKFDLYSNAGEGADSTGFYTNGAMPTIPAVDMTSSGVNLHSGNVMHAHVTYNGTTLTLTLTDTVTNASFTTSGAINIPSVVGGSTAYAGFTGGTGSNSSIQKILSWTYTAN